jgi:hypothetical protein
MSVLMLPTTTILATIQKRLIGRSACQPLAVFSVLPTGPVKKNLTFLAVDLWSLYWSLLCRTKRLASP